MNTLNNIVISGCSYSNHNEYGKHLKSDYNVNNISINGQSNDIILRKIYDIINLGNIPPTVFICQLSYLHRIGFFHSSLNRWIDYQPNYINLRPVINNNKVEFNYSDEVGYFNSGENKEKDYIDDFLRNNLSNMYSSYLKYVHDDNDKFNELIYKIDCLTEYVKSKNHKILYIYWPEILNSNDNDMLSKRNFLNINGNFSMLNWSTVNNYIDDDSHLSENGSLEFSKTLKNILVKMICYKKEIL